MKTQALLQALDEGNYDVAFSAEDRKENIRRIAEVAKLFYENGIVTLCALISPYEEDRKFARSLLPKSRLPEVIGITVLSFWNVDEYGLQPKSKPSQVV